MGTRKVPLTGNVILQSSYKQIGKYHQWFYLLRKNNLLGSKSQRHFRSDAISYHNVNSTGNSYVHSEKVLGGGERGR